MTKCIHILLSGLVSCPFNPRQLRSLNHVFVSCAMKIFNVNAFKIVVECIKMFGASDVAEAVATLYDRFIKRYVSDSSVVHEICAVYSTYISILFLAILRFCPVEFRRKTCKIFDGDSVGFHVEYSMDVPRKTSCSMVTPWTILSLHGIPRSLHGKFHVFPWNSTWYKTGPLFCRIALFLYIMCYQFC